MHRESSQQVAWVQGVVLLALCAAVVLVLFVRLQRPFDRNTLDIQVSALRSQAAEAQLLADNSRSDQISAGFVREHARQLADKVEAVNGKLHKPAQPDLANELSSTRKLGATLRDALLRLSDDGAAREDYGFDRMAQALDSVHEQLKPAAD